MLVVSLLAATPPTMEGRGDYWEGVAQPATPLSCLADTKGLELATPAGSRQLHGRACNCTREAD